MTAPRQRKGIQPTNEKNWDKLTTEPQQPPSRPRTEDIGRLVREIRFKLDSHCNPVKEKDGKVHRKVGKPIKIVEASKHFYICDNGNYPVCFAYTDEGITWEFVK